MRYSSKEETFCLGKFNSGDTVTISMYELNSGQEIPLKINNAVEIQNTGYFKFSTDNMYLKENCEYLYIMKNQSQEEYPGKLIIGGFSDLINKLCSYQFNKHSIKISDGQHIIYEGDNPLWKYSIVVDPATGIQTRQLSFSQTSHFILSRSRIV